METWNDTPWPLEKTKQEASPHQAFSKLLNQKATGFFSRRFLLSISSRNIYF
jgi:hypothetical protein